MFVWHSYSISCSLICVLSFEQYILSWGSRYRTRMWLIVAITCLQVGKQIKQLHKYIFTYIKPSMFDTHLSEGVKRALEILSGNMQLMWLLFIDKSFITVTVQYIEEYLNFDIYPAVPQARDHPSFFGSFPNLGVIHNVIYLSESDGAISWLVMTYCEVSQ